MRSHTDYLIMNTPGRYEIRDITDEVARIVRESAVAEGMVLVSAMHITASVFVNDHQPGLWSDIMTWLEQLAPRKPDYKHHLTGEDNGDAHLKRSCWASKSFSRSPKANSTSAHGSASITANSTDAARSASSSR